MLVSPKTNCLTIPEIEKLLRSNKVQPSAQRIAICRYVLCEADHPTVEDVKSWADKNFPKMSLATVYNTLNLLANVSLVKQLRFPHLDKAVFDANMEPHHHLIDEESGQIIDIPIDAVKVQSELSETYDIHETSIIFTGTRK
tara:strand:+ start:1192 stop:1617 length:426 start_codon:yes stop_codon:yes gene_type:complete